MNTKDFDFDLPQERIAQYSVEPRDRAKLMVIDRVTQQYKETQFSHIGEYLRAGDVLVWNNSKVFKARLHGALLSKSEEELWEHKRDVEIFLVRPKQNDGVWQVLAKPGKHVVNGTRVQFAPDFYGETMLKEKDGTTLMQFFGESETPLSSLKVREKANQYGSIPIPPYVKDEPHQFESYQTVYATQEGSVAAPTAGFHFTESLIAALRERGVEFADITLHVGLGTFLPVKTETIEDHKMHSEWVEVPEKTAYMINQAKREGRRVVAVGTTTTRTLEGIAALPLFEHNDQQLSEYTGDIDIFISPGFQCKIVDALITNFHLPKSTLLMLVSAFVGDREFMLHCYREAVEKEYRFYSFGDAMFIC
ncbi:MAG: tRNA preQ1(34) S-adenosylmethionine ribosyltransferase-isomerase QueA [Candidatus Magasanikbacteria bacterium CG10_big_fil_rev_8_21_14_0_10_43_6]|uniref:S-adenosylmethionine:tRNA ribosyltransferase-isomerase n=1 Tax=Candidatus Magasanikbacteria bacterium CG10_big_fil_rev_8_21_14_0_10_43_6 TaxID=1974650 RepID=A0A2M6VZW3_9BACT|nr:MAG: tRNA preQ1(34) S-adenosylmethionine ribosyltransferase-isomerase QueA [Candidatus Magasanikbacteria bacterium CG10_big_fil_rev_8_21_14_0_10_43_6]